MCSVNRFDFVHQQIEKNIDAKLTLFERYKKEREAELMELAKAADLQADMRRSRKERLKGLRNG